MHTTRLGEADSSSKPVSRILFMTRGAPPETQQEQGLQFRQRVRFAIRVENVLRAVVEEEFRLVAIVKSRVAQSLVTTETRTDEQHRLEQ